jgi:hypothetical protein
MNERVGERERERDGKDTIQRKRGEKRERKRERERESNGKFGIFSSLFFLFSFSRDDKKKNCEIKQATAQRKEKRVSVKRRNSTEKGRQKEEEAFFHLDFSAGTSTDKEMMCAREHSR